MCFLHCRNDLFKDNTTFCNAKMTNGLFFNEKWKTKNCLTPDYLKMKNGKSQIDTAISSST
jgi:hypothetical protein